MSQRQSGTSLGRWPVAVLAWLGSVSCQSCVSQEPAREAAPRSPAAHPAEPRPPRAESLEGATDRARRRASPADEQRTGTAQPASPRSAPAEGSRAAPERKAGPRRGAASSGSAPAPSASAEADAVLPGLEDEPRQLMHRLDRAHGLATPDCPSAKLRKKAVCDLAAQICQLVDRDPNVASVTRYCETAKQRCTDASRRTAERCAG